MDNLNLNLTETCFGCKKSNARWMLQTDSSNLRSVPDYAILFCPVCDQITPEDLEVTDERTLTLPAPARIPPQAVQLTYDGAQAYRTVMGPNRPFRPPGGKTMRRRYDLNGEEIG